MLQVETAEVKGVVLEDFWTEVESAEVKSVALEDFWTEVESDVVGSFLASDTSDFGAVGVDCVLAPEMKECEAEIAAIFLAKNLMGGFLV